VNRAQSVRARLQPLIRIAPETQVPDRHTDLQRTFARPDTTGDAGIAGFPR
jgi:hypothetical protein